MKRAFLAAMVALVGVAGCSEYSINGHSVTDQKAWGLLSLLFAAVVLYTLFSCVETLLSRRAPRTRDTFDLASGRVLSRTKRIPRHRRHRKRQVNSGPRP